MIGVDPLGTYGKKILFEFPVFLLLLGIWGSMGEGYAQGFRCLTEQVSERDAKEVPYQTPASALTSRTMQELRTFRIAVSATGEYTTFHGGTLAGARAAINRALNRINEIFERDLSIRLQLIPNNDQLIFTQPINDPFTNGDALAMSVENQNLLDLLVGDANYDLGMVFSTSGGGLAKLKSVGVAGQKGRAVSAMAQPDGDPFVLDFVAHEIGHQFGAHHTHNNPCSRYAPTAFEPGSGSTIMGYPGICPPLLQPHADAYFHIISIDEIQHFVLYGGGSNVGTVSTSNNLAPVVQQASGPFYIPVSTPFELTASATDPDGDSLTYCWEQFDLGLSGTFQRPLGKAPLFRSFPPVNDSSRTFPQQHALIYNDNIPGEFLPDYARSMHFRLSVRDNHTSGGAISGGLTTVHVTDRAGPFRIIRPNTLNTWMAGSFQEIKWEVAGTDLPPINCNTVDILLSKDGGWTFPHVLAKNVSNSGSAVVKLPFIFAPTCRIKVKSTNQPFFDVSDENIQLGVPSVPTFTMHPYPLEQIVCAPDTAWIRIAVDSLLGFDQPVGLVVKGLPEQVYTSFSANPVVGSDTVVLGIYPTHAFPEGITNLLLEAITPTGPHISHSFSLDIHPSEPGQIALRKPAHGARVVSTRPLFRWKSVGTASKYAIEIATHPSFDSGTGWKIEHIEADSFRLPFHLQANTVYYWRVTEETDCREPTQAALAAFQTFWQGCKQFSATNVPLNIPTFGAPDTVISQLFIMDSMKITDVNVKNLLGKHSWVSDLEVLVRNPAGEEVLLFSGICGDSVSDFSLNFDQEAIDRVIACPPTDGRTYRPVQSLSSLYGSRSEGKWELEVRDLVDLDGGQLRNWELELCARSTAAPAPILLRNETLRTPRWSQRIIGSDFLLASGSDTGPENLTFTVITLPAFGRLEVDGHIIKVGHSFTQADIDENKVSYRHEGQPVFSDHFRFTLSNEKGGWLGSGEFEFLLEGSLGIADASLSENPLELYPNPAREYLHVEASIFELEPFSIEIIDMQGKRVFSQIFPPNPASTHTISLLHIPSGVYSLRCSGKQQKWTRRFIHVSP